MELIYVFITAIFFSTLEPVSKLIAGTVHPMTITFIRFFIGGLILLPFSIRDLKKKNVHLGIKDFVKVALLGILCICISMVILQYAVLKAESPALVAILFSCNSVTTIVLSAIFLKDKITVKKIAALILCVAGIIICSWRNLGTVGGMMSIVLAILSAFSFSLYTVLNKKMLKIASPSILTGFSFIFGSIALLLILLFSGIEIFSASYINNIRDISILAYLGVGVTGIGYWAYFRALEKGSATIASLAFFIKPVLTPFVAFFIVGTPFSVDIFVALAFVICGSFLASFSK